MTERPRRMTIAAVVATTTCVLLVLTLLDAMTGLRTLDSMQRMRQLVDAQGWSSLRDEQIVAFQRVLIFVSGALAATGAVLAVYTLRRHRAARTFLGVVAGLLLFSTALVSTLLPIVLILAVVTMWTGECRDWFDGRERRPRPAPAPPPAAPGAPPVLRSPAQDHWAPPAPDDRPPPTHEHWSRPVQDPWARPPAGPSAPPAAPYAYPTPTQVLDPYSGPAPAPPSPASPVDARPVTVSVAVWLTVVFSLVTFLVFALAVTLLLVARDEMVRAMREQNLSVDLGMSERDLLALVWVACAVCLFWSLAAIALAVLAYRRVNLARVILVVSAVVTAVVGFAAVPVGWLNAIAAVATVGLLFAGGANGWYAGRTRPAPDLEDRDRDPDPPREPEQPEQPEQPEHSDQASWPPPERPREKPPVW